MENVVPANGSFQVLFPKDTNMDFFKKCGISLQLSESCGKHGIQVFQTSVILQTHGILD